MAKTRFTIELSDATYQQMVNAFASIIAEEEINLSNYDSFDITIDCIRREDA